MKSRKPSRRQILNSCAEVREDDGIDPRELFCNSHRSAATHRKTLQLCAQVAETLDGLFAEARDEVLQMLRVASVIPVGDATQLLVTVCPAVKGLKGFNREAIFSRLAQDVGRLRSEMAAAITRKRAPRLVFEVLELPTEDEAR